MSWLTAEEALNRLGTKPQTLYANVSRGRIRAKPDPSDPRRSLYYTADVTRLAERHAGRRKVETVAAEAIQWGDPVLPSAVSTVVNGHLYYRGVDAARLSENATLEETAALLWTKGTPINLAAGGSVSSVPSVAAAFSALAARVPQDLPSLGRSLPALRAEAQDIMTTIASALAPGAPDQPLHRRLAKSWRRPEASDAVRRALVLLADHELNASTFAARVTASAGATLSASVLSGLATLTGPLHGGAWEAVATLSETARRIGAKEAIRRILAQGSRLPAFGHPLYPDGDIRAEALLAHVTPAEVFFEIQEAGEAMIGERVNIDFALTAMAEHFELPRDAPLVIFALARSCGWMAHAMEQVESGHLIRPRARYTGPAIETSGA
ncbi:citrate synthase [Rhizobium sp. SEMIA 4085]|uniref:citrate synthase (unknown stereospecificity) n=1 Tax=Rhizobium gallicum bv. gallicum R602sp TaxID=1041138 RepID=A0A0B4X040_9HYPH|nr:MULTISPECIES: citrate synthase [Rhizobium]AJD41309.1 citrate synthase protein [Rhizobium gallicum bv. gallicum R602sp]NNH32792.1 citrate synthase [Rhizobium sp. SEMIA 4085]